MTYRGLHLQLVLALASSLALVSAAPLRAQQNAPAAAPPAALIADLVAANHVLYHEGVVDGYGHVSVRSPTNPQHYFLSRSLAPALVTADDIMEFDLDSNPIDQRGRRMYLERFIHGQIYKANPAVNAVVHSHSPAVIPFGVTGVPLRPIMHTAAFLGTGVPVFEIREKFNVTDMLVTDNAKGKALADVLGGSHVALMRGHGDVVTAADIPTVVARAIYTEKNARVLLQTLPLGRPINYLSKEEVDLREKEVMTETRAWDLWKIDAERNH